MRKINSKTFSIIIISNFLISIVILATSIFITSKVFDDKSYNWEIGEIHSEEPLLREEKSLYIGQKKVSYNAYILGGSKAGFLQKNTLDTYSGLNFYNFFSTSGGFKDYKLYSDFLIDRHGENIYEIILHLSTYETKAYSFGDYIPVSMQKSLLGKCNSIIKKFKKLYLNIDLFIAYLKGRNYKDYSIRNTGEYDMKKSLSEYYKNPDKFVKKYVTVTNNDIEFLFENISTVSKSVCNKNIETLWKIKKRCDENNIKLKVVIGAHYISKMKDIWGKEFDDYLCNLISVNGEIWTFCGINDVNMNPYNFFNDEHFWFFTGDKMIENMYAPVPNTTDMDAFGILLTKDNIKQYLESQKQKWLKLKTEYEVNGTIKLYGKNDPSYLGPQFTE